MGKPSLGELQGLDLTTILRTSYRTLYMANPAKVLCRTLDGDGQRLWVIQHRYPALSNDNRQHGKIHIGLGISLSFCYTCSLQLDQLTPDSFSATMHISACALGD